MILPDAVRTVLVAEDDSLMRSLLHDIFVEFGFQVQVARDGAEALEAVERARVDLVLADGDLPYLDGWTLCRVLRGRPATRDVPLVLMSGAVGEGALTPPYVDAFLTKPFSLDALRTTVEQVLK